MYIAKNRIMKHRPRRNGMGGWLDDLLSGGADPTPPAPSPEDINTGPTVQVSTIGGQVSSIPSSQAGGGYTTIGGFVSVGGVCKPTDSVSLGKFKELQRQANRVADALGFAKIGVDGAIGAQTIALMNSIKSKMSGYDDQQQGWANFLANQNTSTCSAIAGGTDNLTPMLSAAANALGVSSSVASPAPESPPTIYNPITGQLKSQGIAGDVGDLFGNMSTGMQIAALGIAGGLGYFALKAHDRKAKKR